jgi:hypothetical protein
VTLFLCQLISGRRSVKNTKGFCALQPLFMLIFSFERFFGFALALYPLRSSIDMHIFFWQKRSVYCFIKKIFRPPVFAAFLPLYLGFVVRGSYMPTHTQLGILRTFCGYFHF